VTDLYRVLPYLATARAGEPGHPLHLPPSTGASRLDNPGRYEVLYLGDSPAGAIAEAFGWSPVWTVGLFRGSPSLPGSVRALAHYVLDDEQAALCDLDDAARLVELGLRPSHVVTRDRTVTQHWAAAIFERDEFAGVRWWSYYDPRWGSIGMWDLAALALADVRVLDDIDQPEVVQAADVLARLRR
jgi:RES domain.